MANPLPTSIDVEKTTGIRLAWSDGSVSSHSLQQLRSLCPCAQCKEDRAKEQSTKKKPLLKVLPGNYAGDIVIASVELVGNYALKIAWTDGHDTGIYSFAYLREISAAK